VYRLELPPVQHVRAEITVIRSALRPPGERGQP